MVKKNVRLLICFMVLLFVAGILAGCSGQTPQKTEAPKAPATEATYAHPEYLLSVDQLKGLLNDPKLVILDVRKPEDYAKGHIPGAVNVWRPDYQDPNNKIKEMRATPEQMEKLLGKLGISNDSKVVIYTDSGFDATRFWWLLDMYGFKNAQILNGGINKWMDSGNKTTTDPAQVKPAEFKIDKAAVKTNTVADMDEVINAVKSKDKNTVIIDARTADEYNGVTVRDGATRKGHVPGAINIDQAQTLAADKTIKKADELKKMFEEKGVTPDKKVYVYCHSGARSSLIWFELSQLLGYSNVKNFDPSWIGWSGDESLSIEAAK